jgi:hypothetical protein
MDINKSKEVQPVTNAESNVGGLDDATVKGLRKRNIALVMAVAASILFGGSCHSELSCGGIKTVGCSCVDKAPKKEEPKKPERMDF